MAKAEQSPEDGHREAPHPETLWSKEPLAASPATQASQVVWREHAHAQPQAPDRKFGLPNCQSPNCRWVEALSAGMELAAEVWGIRFAHSPNFAGTQAQT